MRLLSVVFSFPLVELLKSSLEIYATVLTELDNSVGNGFHKLQVMAGKYYVALKGAKAFVHRCNALKVILESIQRTFSPPDNTFTGLYTSSPLKSILPRKPLM